MISCNLYLEMLKTIDKSLAHLVSVFWSVGGRIVPIWVICKEPDVTPESQIDDFELD